MIMSTGCQGVSSRSAGATNTPVAVSVSPSITSVGMGATQQFSATAKYSDGSTGDVTATASWTVAAPAVATISSTGLVTAVASGATTVAASLNGVTGNSTLTVAMAAKMVTAIAVSPSNASVSVGATQQLSATATYGDGSVGDVSSTATWTIATPAVATVNSTGQATGVAAGSTTVTAALSGVSGTATLNVAVKTLTAVSVSPSAAGILAGATQQFSATATYSDSSTADVTATASWTVATAAVATISSKGLATAVAVGSTTVTASLSGVSGTATLNVVTKTLTAISVSPSTASIVVGATQQFIATATYSDSSTADVSSTASWTVATAAMATISSTGLATGVALGSATVTASLDGVNENSTLSIINPAVGTNGNVIANIQTRSGNWRSYAQYAPRYIDCSPSPCGGITWSMHPGIPSPSLSGNATQFSLGGTRPYGDVLFAAQLIGPDSPQIPDADHTLVPTLHNFVYDSYFFVTDASITQALEFDINMYFNGVGMTWGHQCNHLGDGDWDIWNSHHWVSSGVPCTLIQGAWNHLTLVVQREPDNTMLYESIELNGTTYPLNKTYPPAKISSSWWGVTANYQMDGDHAHTANTTYLDNFSLTYW